MRAARKFLLLFCGSVHCPWKYLTCKLPYRRRLCPKEYRFIDYRCYKSLFSFKTAISQGSLVPFFHRNSSVWFVKIVEPMSSRIPFGESKTLFILGWLRHAPFTIQPIYLFSGSAPVIFWHISKTRSVLPTNTVRLSTIRLWPPERRRPSTSP